MVVWSQIHRWQLLGHLPCHTLHPDRGCVDNAIQLAVRGTWGSAKFFVALYAIQWLMKHRTLDREVLSQQAICLAKSSVFGGACGAMAVTAICGLRRLLGEFNMFSLGFMPGMIGGVGIFLEDKTRRPLDLTLLITLILDLYLKVLKDAAMLRLTPVWELVVFSVASSALLYTLRLDHEAQTILDLYLKVLKDAALLRLTPVWELVVFSVASSALLYTLRLDHEAQTVLWPVTPHKLPRDPGLRSRCAHSGDCWREVATMGATYLSYGLAAQIIKVVATHFSQLHRPEFFLRALLRLENLRLPIFSVTYICLLKGTCCLLRGARGRDEGWHILPAGALASLSYLIQPNFTLALCAISNLSQIVCWRLRQACGVPAGPWQELAFTVCMGLMFHGRACYPQVFPSYLLKVMDGTTNGRAQFVYNLVEEKLLLRY